MNHISECRCRCDAKQTEGAVEKQMRVDIYIKDVLLIEVHPECLHDCPPQGWATFAITPAVGPNLIKTRKCCARPAYH